MARPRSSSGTCRWTAVVTTMSMIRTAPVATPDHDERDGQARGQGQQRRGRRGAHHRAGHEWHVQALGHEPAGHDARDDTTDARSPPPGSPTACGPAWSWSMATRTSRMLRAMPVKLVAASTTIAPAMRRSDGCPGMAPRDPRTARRWRGRCRQGPRPAAAAGRPGRQRQQHQRHEPEGEGIEQERDAQAAGSDEQRRRWPGR